ncbi:MAG: hypothetical protein SX243_20185 [Acidobacteriota bacterium]|nr:hypothetical protein [Acidobacteriota bacterium]
MGRRRRFLDELPLLALLLVGLSLAGVVWLTYHPEHPWLRRAESWPVVGPAAKLLRQAYSPPKPSERVTQAPATPSAQPLAEVLSAQPPEPELPAWIVPEGQVGFEWLRAGTRLHTEPDRSSEVWLTLDNFASLPVLERRADSWIRVRVGARQGWLVLDEGSRLDHPPLGAAPAPVKALSGRPPDPRRLERALAVMGHSPTSPAELYLGPYPFYTDLRDTDPRDRALLRQLDEASTRVEEIYRQRYGLDPVGNPAAAVVLFQAVEDYRRYQAHETAIASLPSHGHAGYGLAVFYRGSRSDAEVTATLIHELTHLLNRRGIGPALPAWLDEGLAEDLAEIGIQPESKGEYRTLLASATARPSGGAMVGVSLQELLRTDRDSLSSQAELQRFYQLSRSWIGYLLDADPAQGARFRSYLEAVANGAPATPEELQRHLRRPWAELEKEFTIWRANLG